MSEEEKMPSVEEWIRIPNIPQGTAQEGRFPKLRVKSKGLLRKVDYVYFEPEAGVAYWKKVREGVQTGSDSFYTSVGDKLVKEAVIYQNSSSTLGWITWKIIDGKCKLLIKDTKSKSGIVWLYGDMKLVKGMFGSPLPDGREISAKADLYSSSGFLNFGKDHSGFLNFGDSGEPTATAYGNVGFLNFGKNHTGVLNFGNHHTGFLNFGSSESALPPSLQARGQLYPMLKRVKLANAKQPEEEVWQFRTSGKNNIFLGMSEKTLDASELLEDKPHTWYLLENPTDVAGDTYVLGIGRKTARVHVPGSAIAFTILNESDLFSTDTLMKPLKYRAETTGAESTSNLSGDKLKRVIEELAFKVSYKTLRTMMKRVAPEGVDPTLKIKVRVEEEVQEVRLVLYAAQKKHVRFLGTVIKGWIDEVTPDEEKITHLVAVWTESGELIAAYWASAGDSLDDALHLVHDVAITIQKGEETPASLIEALLDTEPPTDRFMHVPGEYGASVREACNQDFARHKKASSEEALRDISTNIVGLLADAAHVGIDIAEGETIGALKGLFGASLEEPYGEEYELSAPTVKKEQPYTKIRGVYDQRPRSTCVLCSIGYAVSMMAAVGEDKSFASLENVLKSISNVISPDSVPSTGLVMRDAFRKLEPVLKEYGPFEWKRISTTVDTMKKALDAGIPIVVGTKFDGGIFKYSSNLDTPLSGPEGVEMLHCVTIVGYDDADSTFTVLNSWGGTWGRNGAMIIDQEYQGFDRAFIIFEESRKFGAVDIAENLPTLSFSTK